MKNQDQQTEAQKTQTVQGFIANPQVFLNEERETITHRLGDDLRIEMPINLYKKIRVYINNGGSQDFCYTWLTTTKITKGTPKCPHQFMNLSLVYLTSKSFHIEEQRQ